MSLTKNDLYKRHDQLAQLKHDTYEGIYKKCVNTIKLTSNTGELMCIFRIPSLVFGSSYPLINIEGCALYIIQKLSQTDTDIKVSFIKPDTLFIDWRRE